MDFTLEITVLASGLFVGMLLLLETGRRLGLRWLAQEAEAARTGFGVVEGAVFALMSLLIAFTFSGAASRFDARRHLVVEEANAIGTAYLRLDLLPASAQPALRERFRQYVEARLDTYRKLPVCHHHRGDGVRHHRPRISPSGVDSGRRRRSGAR